MREDLERKEHRENCPSRTQYQFGKGKRKFVCLDADKDCNSKVRCRYMDNYDAEQGITHRKERGEDFYD